MERLREEPTETEAGTSTEEVAPAFTIRQELRNELEAALAAYAVTCSAAKAALLQHRIDPQAYGEARARKDIQHDACIGVFARVLAHIGVRAP